MGNEPNHSTHLRMLTTDDARAEAKALVTQLAPLTEAEAWELAQTDPSSLKPTEAALLERLDSLDWLATGVTRGCHYGACTSKEVNTSWRE